MWYAMRNAYSDAWLAGSIEPMLYVAFSGAVFPMAITIGREPLSAVDASEFIYSFLVHSLRMGIPPRHPAKIRAEDSLFSFCGLDNLLAALFAGIPIAITITGVPICVVNLRHLVFSTIVILWFLIISVIAISLAKAPDRFPGNG